MMDLENGFKQASLVKKVFLLALAAVLLASASMSFHPGRANANQVLVTCNNTLSDAATINNAINGSAEGDEIVFRKTCLINQTIILKNFRTYRGDNRRGVVLRQADNANLKAIMASETYLNNNTWAGEGVTIRSLTIDGNKASNTSVATAGIVMRSWESTISDVHVMNMGGDGIRVTNLSENGTALSGTTMVNGSITGIFVENNNGHGIYVQDTGNAVTDWTLADSWIAGSGMDGIHMENAAGWMVARNHVYGVPQNAIYADRLFGTTISDNYIEGFGESSTPGIYYGIFGAAQGAGFTSTIIGNRVHNIDNESNPGSTYRYIGIARANYGTGMVNVTGNSIRGAGTPRGTGLYYSGGSNSLLVVSSGNLVNNVNTARTVTSGASLVTSY